MPKFTNVSIDPKANIYFDGKVTSHAIILSDKTEKTIGLLYPGEYHFGTGAAELMEIIGGECNVLIDGTTESLSIEAGQSFEIAGNSGFTITVKDCICEYVCSYLPA